VDNSSDSYPHMWSMISDKCLAEMKSCDIRNKKFCGCCQKPTRMAYTVVATSEHNTTTTSATTTTTLNQSNIIQFGNDFDVIDEQDLGATIEGMVDRLLDEILLDLQTQLNSLSLSI
jgi:hypothetical protein